MNKLIRFYVTTLVLLLLKEILTFGLKEILNHVIIP